MGLISTRDIAELTQIATQLAAQTMQSNGELLSKPGRPEVRPLSLNSSPSQLLSQSLTNMLEPANQQLAKTLMGQRPTAMASKASSDGEISMFGEGGQRQRPRLMGISTQEFGPKVPSGGGGGINQIMELANTFLRGSNGGARATETAVGQDTGGGGGNEITRLFSTMTGGGRGGANGASATSSSTSGSNNMLMPSLRQLMPGASRNFGFQQGEGCLPFIGEFMGLIYGNCVRQADEGTWDTWGKEITNALMGGKIDLLRASKETCKKGAEREQCGQLRRAVSECDIIGSIQLASNMQRAISRCDEISGIIDQNPTTVMNQMNGLINGEMAQGFLNNFLG